MAIFQQLKLQQDIFLYTPGDEDKDQHSSVATNFISTLLSITWLCCRFSPPDYKEACL